MNLPLRRVLLAVASAVIVAAPAAAADEDARLGVTIWGVSYHVNDSIDYEPNNWGAGVRYYVSRHVFVEGDALRNSNRGIVLPLSVGAELPVASIGHACRVSAMGAVTVAFYQNLRTNRDYVKWGPVPGVSVRCGHVQPNLIAVLSPTNQVLAALVASVTIRF
jgi:Outer membrane protein beta-barrel domain